MINEIWTHNLRYLHLADKNMAKSSNPELELLSNTVNTDTENIVPFWLYLKVCSKGKCFTQQELVLLLYQCFCCSPRLITYLKVAHIILVAKYCNVRRFSHVACTVKKTKQLSSF